MQKVVPTNFVYIDPKEHAVCVYHSQHLMIMAVDFAPDLYSACRCAGTCVPTASLPDTHGSHGVPNYRFTSAPGCSYSVRA